MCFCDKAALNLCKSNGSSPPTPASTPIKYKVSQTSDSPRTTLHASMTRETSPEAIFLRTSSYLSWSLYISSIFVEPTLFHCSKKEIFKFNSIWAEPICRWLHLSLVTASQSFGAAATRTLSAWAFTVRVSFCSCLPLPVPHGLFVSLVTSRRFWAAWYFLNKIFHARHLIRPHTLKICFHTTCIFFALSSSYRDPT